MRTVLEQAEEALGNNLTWISDLADIGVRQGDADTLRRLDELRTAWMLLVSELQTIRAAANPAAFQPISTTNPDG